MAHKIPWPIAADPTMHKEEEWTLSRTTSLKNRGSKTTTSVIEPSRRPSPEVTDSHPHRRRFVFTDPVAFRYLEDDPSTIVLERRGRLKGYELYLVEQWACSRVHPTFIITTYTGDESRSVLVGVLGVPADEATWSPRLRVYVKAISEFHARPKDTNLGTLMVTNLSSFPSALTVIPVPDGDVKKHREDFIVNENLKRLGCSGRSGLSLSAPAGATQAKFHQLYKTSDRIPLYSAVIELVKLCQVALMIFGKLDQEYADGLLCDVTEKAVNDWWTEVGSEYYNLEPSDGILGPTTVAALLGMLMGARNRLSYYGAPVTKDVFDISSLKRGIAYFQKSQKLERTRRLDRQTLHRLHRLTAKAAAGETWAVPKAVKSTVAELSGKGGEMVMGMVGGSRDKAAIGDIETLDIDRFVSLVHGERSKWLWYGKPRRSGTNEAFGKSMQDVSNMVLSKDEQGGYVWSSKRNDSFTKKEEEDTERDRKRDSGNSSYFTKTITPAGSVIESPGVERDGHRKTVFKSVTGKMSDARSGFGRIKDAVGLRGHISRHSKDEGDIDGSPGSYFSSTPGIIESAILSSTPVVGKAFTWKMKPEEYQNGFPKEKQPPAAAETTPDKSREPESPQSESKLHVLFPADFADAEAPTKDPEAEARWIAQMKDIRRDLIAKDPSIVGSIFGDADLDGPLFETERDTKGAGVLLYRRHSICAIGHQHQPNDARWPRHVSFSDIEEAIFRWEDIGTSYASKDGLETDNSVALQKQRLLAGDLKCLFNHIHELQISVCRWTERKVNDVEDLDTQAAHDQEEFQSLYAQLSEAYQIVKQNSQDILSEERSQVTEAVKDIEVLGAKLEYEINALVSKVEDVEEGVTQFKGQVDDLESRALELEQQLRSESWMHWAVRTVTGIGTGPYLGGR